MDAHLPALRLNEKIAQDPKLALKQDAGRYLASIIAASLGAGILSRTLVGANRLAKQDPPLASATRMSPLLIEPKPEQEAGEGEAQTLKYAALTKFSANTDIDPTFFNQVGNFLSKHLFEGPGFLRGDQATSPWGIPLFWPLAAAGGLGSFYGGYKVTDKVLDARRKAEMNQELEDIKQQYEDTVRQRLMKRSHVDSTSVPQLLDELADASLEKRSQDPVPPPVTAGSTGSKATNFGSGVAGAYLMYALLSSLGAGHLMYKGLRKNAPRQITEEALAERARQRYGMTQPMYVSEDEGMTKKR